ncbi:MAG: hypothetical protein JWO17_3117 [Actinomycetia bacterium]|nr:hypothetical protein [Actinomycetes bacterium]
MKRRLASPRFRRRLFWAGGSTSAVALLVFVGFHFANTGRSNATAIDRTKTAWVYKAPAHMRLTTQDRLELFNTSSRFVRTAVARKHLDAAWEMLGPEMKAGQTRKSWDTGFNNVVPFKADGIESWDILYAYEGDVAVDLSLVSGRRSGNNWAGKTFTLELKRDSASRRWLVASWVPKGIGGGGTLSPNRRSGPPPPAVTAHISARWLFLPGVFLGGLLLVLGAAGVRSAVRSRRAARRYAEALGYKSSSNPS